MANERMTVYGTEYVQSKKGKPFRKSTKGLHSISSKQGASWRNLKQNVHLKGQKYEGGFLRGKAVERGLTQASRTVGKGGAVLGALIGAINIGKAVKEGVEAVRAHQEDKKQEVKLERKYGTTGRAMATRHAEQIKDAKSNVEVRKDKKVTQKGFKTIGATAGGKYYRRGKIEEIKLRLVGRD